jgi:RNA polymerase sigma factor (TIGR02999 family)
MADFSTILVRLDDGDAGAMDELLRLVDRELRKLAASHLKNEASGITLQPTELVNEAYLRLAGQQQNWQNRAHFFGAASEAMRRILVDHARRKRSQKRGGTAEKVELSDAFLAVEGKADELLAVHEALGDLELHDQQAAQLVKLRYFVGMKHHEAAAAMSISKRTADRLWLVGKTWLYKVLARQ